MTMSDDYRRALGIAVQVLETMPERRQRGIDDMRALLEGRAISEEDRNLAALRAIATAFVFRLLDETPTHDTGFDNRLIELEVLLDLMRPISSEDMALMLLEASGRIIRTRQEINSN